MLFCVTDRVSFQLDAAGLQAANDALNRVSASPTQVAINVQTTRSQTIYSCSVSATLTIQRISDTSWSIGLAGSLTGEPRVNYGPQLDVKLGYASIPENDPNPLAVQCNIIGQDIGQYDRQRASVTWGGTFGATTDPGCMNYGNSPHPTFMGSSGLSAFFSATLTISAEKAATANRQIQVTFSMQVV